MQIRDEQPDDRPGIFALVARAFDQPDEARLIDALRADGDAAVSLVAEQAGTLLGHVLLSPLQAPFPALALAPLAVAPDHQNCGIGAALVTAAIERARRSGASALFVLGDPAYYARFGFSADLAAGFASLYAGPYLMVLPLQGPLPATTGPLAHAPAFAGLG